MANVAHSTLTGSNLHENKGVASAANSTVATASSGTTVWQKLTNAHLTASANPFGAQLLQVRDLGVLNIPKDDWRIRPMNTVIVNEISGASLVDNSYIVLPAGTYYIKATLTSCAGGDFRNQEWFYPASQCKLYDHTAASDIMFGNSWSTGLESAISFGSNAGTNTGFAVGVRMPCTMTIEGRFGFGSGRTLSIQQYATWFDHFSVYIGDFAPAINTQAYIWKVA